MSKVRWIIALGLLASNLVSGRVQAAALDPTSSLFTSHSQGDVSLSSGNYALTLGSSGPTLIFFNGPNFTTVATGFVYNGINVFDFHSLNIAAGANIVVTQSSSSGPIAILSSTSITMAGSIDVSAGTVGSGPGGGPGAGNTAVGGNGTTGSNPGASGAGAFIVSGGGGGGFGGVGTAGQSTPIVNQITHTQVGTLPGGAGGSAYESLADHLQGGSMGGFGGGNNGNPNLPGGAGFGGGAIELGAVQTVTIAGMIKANGGNASTTQAQFYGGGGGGSGGGVFLHGDSVNVSGTISALGGNGGPGAFGSGNGGAGSGGLVLAEYNGPRGNFINTGTINVGNGRFDLASVPEPASLILLGMSALGGVVATGWRFRRR